MKTMYTPDKGPDPQGYHAAAEVIAKTLRSDRQDLSKAFGVGRNKGLRREVSEAELRAMLRTRRFTGNHLSLNDARGARLRKVFGDFADAAREAGLKNVGPLTIRANNYDSAGVRGDSTHQFKKIHGAGPHRGLGLPPEGFSPRLAKGLPPEDSGIGEDNQRAKDGADLAHDAIAGEGKVRPSQRLNPLTGPNTAPHASSQRQFTGNPPIAVQNDGTGRSGDPALDAIKLALRNPLPLRPGALANAEQDPNRDDSFLGEEDEGGDRDTEKWLKVLATAVLKSR